jgi:HSP20 family protein
MNAIITRRNPLYARPTPFFGREFDRFFGDLWGGFDRPTERAFVPRVDVEETETEYRLAAELPGLEEKDIEVIVDDGVLTLKGERRDETDEEKGYRHVETFRGHFERAFRLGDRVDEEGIRAVYRNGVLEVTIPKLPEVGPEVRNIPVTAG